MNSNFLRKHPSKKPYLKAKISQITTFKALSYILKHRAFQKWPWICCIFIFKEVEAHFLKI